MVGFLVRAGAGLPLPGRVTVTCRDGRSRSADATSDGRFRVAGLPRAEKVCFVARSDGLGAYMAPEVEVPLVGDADLGWIHMKEAMDLTVVVIDGVGRPVSGATVSARAPVPGNLCSGPIHIEPWPIMAASITDGHGGATLKGLSPSAWALLAVAPGYARRNVLFPPAARGAESRVTIELQPGHSIDGRVFLTEGVPAAGAVVVTMESGEVWSDSICCLTVKADAEGRFHLEGLGKGDYPLLVQAYPGVLEPGANVSIPESSTVDIWLPPRATVEGRVSDAKGNEPVAAARVSGTIPVVGHHGFWALVETLTDATGTFRMQDLPIGEFNRLEVRAAGYLEYPGSLDQPPEAYRPLAAGKTIRFEVALHRGGSVRGVARDQKGAPVPRAWVRVCTSLRGREPLDSPVTWTADDGSFFVPMAQPGRAYLQARGPGCHNEGSTIGWVEAREEGGIPESSSVTVPAEGEVRKELVMFPDWLIRGRVVLADGTPAVGFVPSLCRSRDGQWIPITTGDPTDANGWFFIHPSRGGANLVVEAAGPDGPAARSHPFVLEQGRNPGDVIVTVPMISGLAGRVRREDGAPLHDVLLHLVRGDPGLMDRPRRPAVTRSTPPVAVAADGTFSASGLHAGKYTITCTAEGCSETRGPSISLVDGERVEGIEVVLRKGLAVSGVVLDPAGKAVVGAEVFVWPSGDMFDPASRKAAAITDDGGRFRAEGLAEGKYDLRAHLASRPGTFATVEAGTEDVRLVMAPGFAIAGRLIDAETEKPVGGIALHAYERNSTRRVPFKWSLHESNGTVSGQDGTFTLAGLGEGTYDVIAGDLERREGTLYPSRTVDGVRAGTQDLVIRLERGRCIGGRLVDPEGRPVASRGLELKLGYPISGGGWASDGASLLADGTFLFSCLPSGRYTLRIESRSFGTDRDSTWLPTRVEEIQTGTEDLVVQLHRGLPISGKILDTRGGVPSGDLWLRIGLAGSRHRPPGNAFQMVQPDGTFVTGALEEGHSYDLSVSREGRTRDSDRWVARGVPAGAVNVELKPEAREGTISGTVVDEEGKPAPEGVPVTAIPGDSTLNRAVTRTLSGGTFLLKGMGTVAYTIRAGGPGCDFAWAGTWPVLLPGSKDVALRIRKGITLRGVLRRADGTPMEETLLLVLLGEGDPEEFPAHTDKDGKFEIGGLPPGELVLKMESIVPEERKPPDLGKFHVPCEPLELTAPPEAERR